MRIGLDLDGTLLDSRPRHLAALRQSARTVGVGSLAEEDVEAYARLKAEGDTGLTALRRLRIPKAEEISQEWFNTIENDDLLSLDHLYKDTLRALQSERALSRTFIVVTSRRNAGPAHRQVTESGLSRYVSEVIVVEATSLRTKAMVSREHGLQAVIGDTEVDLQWALELGIPFYASCFGFRSRSFWDARNVASYGSLSDIFQHLELSDSGVR